MEFGKFHDLYSNPARNTKKLVLGGPGQKMGSGTIKIPYNYCRFHSSAQRCYFLAKLWISCEIMDFHEFNGKSMNSKKLQEVPGIQRFPQIRDPSRNVGFS